MDPGKEKIAATLKSRAQFIQSEVSQKEKNKYRMLTHIWTLEKKKVLTNLGAGQE